MAEINPAFVLHNAGDTHTAELFRLLVSGMSAGFRTSGSLAARGGVCSNLGGGLIVTAQGSPSLVLNVASGAVFIPGSEGDEQGIYFCVNDATDTVTMDAAHGSLPRIDLVIAKVSDSVYSGATNEWTLDKVTGTAAASPTAPSLPANSVLLATITRAAADDTIATGDIADTRPLFAASGGIIPCTSSQTASIISIVNEGQFGYETDLGRLWVKRAGALQYMSNYQGGVQSRFLSNSTWFKPTSAKYVRVQVQGGGGAAGGAPATAAGQASAGGGGQGGAYAETWYVATSLASSVAITVGGGGTGVSGTTGNSGGTSSFGALVSAAGGAGGGSSAATSTNGVVSGAIGAQAMTGDIQIAGGGGGFGVRIPPGAGGGMGGGSFLGNGGGSAGTAQAGTGYGGGGGGIANGASSSAQAGGAGAAGIVIVTTWI